MHAIAITLNVIVSLASAWWALAALTRPERLSGSTESVLGERYFARLYAVRAMPLELASAIVPALAHGEAVLVLLFAAAAVQAADSAIGAQARKRDMALGAAGAAIIHVVCALALQ